MPRDISEAPARMPGAHPSATVTLLRDGAAGLEVLMVRRHASLSFHGGAWVFPGGRIDDEDFAAAADDIGAAARLAAVREAHEEAGTIVPSDQLVLISRWVTPEGLPKRFDTWFFAGTAARGEIVVDGGEIDDYRWLRPQDALAAQRRSEIELPPPTFVTLSELNAYDRVDPAIEALRQRRPQMFLPRMCMVEGGACTLYEGDAGYETHQADCPGARHRLWMVESGWRYECDPELAWR